MHPVRWEDGAFSLPAHPDAEGELVLAALGGEKAGCVELAEAWGRHADDLGILAVGPRSAADTITVTWQDVEEFRCGPSGGPPRVHRVPRRAGPGRMTVSAAGPVPAGAAGGEEAHDT